MGVTLLILCTGNSARSIMAEALLNHLGGGRVRALSAGSHPRGAPHPEALERLTAEGIATDGLASKAWDEFARSSGPQIDVVVTVCDDAASEECPLFPGPAGRVHWGIPDPVAAPHPLQPEAFAKTFATLRDRILTVLSQPIEEMTAPELADELRKVAGG